MNGLFSFICCTGQKQYATRSNGGPNEVDQEVTNKEIERRIRLDKKRRKNQQHILLLGTGESGKSTFLKQMKIINGKKWTPEEINTFRDIIWDNIYKGVLVMLDARQNLGIAWSNPKTAMAAERLEGHYSANRTAMRQMAKSGELVWDEASFLQLVPDLKFIWKDDGIKQTFMQRSMLLTENFSENTRYYLDNLSIIGIPDYIPTNEQIVWSRKPTDSIIEEEIDIHGSSLVFIDVGGQTKERRKWCKCFTDMTSVLFVIACSHYDERYFDRITEENRNKLQEAMDVFEGLVNHKSFTKVSIMIFFNKFDVLKEKIAQQTSNISDEFDSFPAKGNPFNLEEVKNFMVESFVSRVVDNPAGSDQELDRVSMSLPKKRMLYRHFTTAIDRRNIENVFKNMRDTILERNLDKLMMN